MLNEAFNDDGTLRNTLWYNAPGIGYAGQGTKYIEEAFKRARAADPGCELVYNDYGAETGNAKSDAIYAMVRDFKVRGVPLDGVGFQFHLTEMPNLSSLRTNLQRFNDLGLSLNLTELDVSLPVGANGVATASALASQADIYFNVVGVALAFPRTHVVQTWGFSDRYSWIPGFSPGYGAALPLDKNFNRKPAWWALRDVLANQAETLALVELSTGDSTVLLSSPLYSAGAARQLKASGANDFITLAGEVPYSGEYNVRVGVRKNNAGGQFQLSASRAPGGALANLGPVQETYAAVATNVELNLGSFTFTGAGTNFFRFTVAGKFVGSGGYALTLDYLRFIPTGADGNQAPTVSALPNVTVEEGQSTGPLPFTVSDRETVESALAITTHSSDPTLLPTNNIVIAGGGAERLLVATPVIGKSGAAVITVIVADAAGASASNSFVIGVAPRSRPLVASGSVWRFNDTGMNLGTAWRATNYNDTAWPSGPSMLGFGDANGILPATLVSSNRQITTYFRKTVVIPPDLNATSLHLRILRDDAAVVYFNGSEVWRDTNITQAAITNATPAWMGLNGEAESTWLATNFSPAVLHPGTNLVAAEVHQNNATSSDLVFDLELYGITPPVSPALSLSVVGKTLRLNWPGWAAGLALHTATNLTTPIIWLSTTNAPVLSNGLWSVPFPLENSGQRFYRLQALGSLAD